MTTEEIKALTHRHVRTTDKFLRMFAGLSSELVSFDRGIIALEIRIDERWDKIRRPSNVTALQLARDWRYERELRHALGYKVWIYRANSWSGMTFDLNDSYEKVLAEFNRRLRPGVSPVDLLIAVEEGTFAETDPQGSIVVDTARGLGLAPVAHGLPPNVQWFCTCPGRTGHYMRLDADSETFACGSCGDRGGPKELKELIQRRWEEEKKSPGNSTPQGA